jgi:Delta7-sterol 5-desaturase
MFGLDSSTAALLGGVFTRVFLMEASRYLVVALLLWLVVHVLLKRRLAHRLIAPATKDTKQTKDTKGLWPSGADMRREASYSLGTLAVFAALGLCVVAGVWQGQLVIYRDPSAYGLTWLLVSLPLMIIWHDFYFYWTHRLMHTRWMLRHVHGVHHRSRNPSPWAAYAFHPLEALINGLVTPLALCVVPLHWSVLLLFSLHQIVRNAHGHLAVETMPRGFVRHGLFRHFTTTTHHHMHHETARGHYGLWFTWWDRWCGTERADYAARFDAATQPHKAT